MGLMASIIVEEKMAKGWRGIRPKGQTQHWLISASHNQLVEAHLIGAFNVADPGNMPHSLSDKIRFTKQTFQGFPDDLSKEAKESLTLENYDNPHHKPNWCSAMDLITFDWTKPIRYQFWLNGPMYLKWRTNGSDDYQSVLPGQLDYFSPHNPEPPKDGLEVSEEQLSEWVAEARARTQTDWRYKNEPPIKQEEGVQKRMHDWAHNRWTRFDLKFPMYQVCDFLSDVMPLLLNKRGPANKRIICGVA